MGGFVGAVTSVIGLASSISGAKKADSRAAAANDAAAAVALEQLDFSKEQYADWLEVYGPIQDNLSDYYQNLGTERITTMGLQDQQREFQLARDEVSRDFAKRGLADSGLDVATQSTLTFQNAEARAKIRTGAEDQVNQQKLGFLGIGLGQQNALLNSRSEASATASNGYRAAAGAYTSQATDYRKQFIDQTLEVGGTFLGGR